MRNAEPSLYGLVAEFESGEALLMAAEAARQMGYRKMDAYSPLPVHGLSEAIGFRDIWVPWIIFICGVLGAAIGFGLQCWVSAQAYPLNVGGRPLVTWPSFIPVTFECTVLLAAFGAFVGMLALNGLPKPYHSIFNAPGFERATNDRFFLCIESGDPRFDPEETRDFLRGTGALNVAEVER